MKARIRNIFTIVLAILFSAALIFVIIFSALKISESIQDQTINGYFISILSATLGGLCTLGGVVITLVVTHIIQKRKTVKDNKPELFVPGKFDSTKIVKIQMTYENEAPFTISNYKVVLKNSDKAPLIIESILSENTIFVPKNVSYIEKDSLFDLAFYCNKKVNELFLTIRSLDDCKYKYKVLLDDGDVSLEEVGE